MRFLLQSGGLICLTILLLAGCDNKKESGGVAQPPGSPSQVETLPATPVAGSTSSKLVLLPAAPTAKDHLLAVFKGESGQVTYRWEKDGATLDDEELDRLAAKHLAKGSLITVIVDNAGKSYSASVTIGNRPPVVQQVSFKNPAIHRGVDIELEAKGDDADGDDVVFSYKWFRNDNQIEGFDGPRLPGDQFIRGDQISFQVIPFDGEDEGSSYIGRPLTVPNAPPDFLSNPPLQFLSETYSYQAQASDPDGDVVTYALENPPPGMIVDKKTGQINWPLADLAAGVYRISIVADDAQGQKVFQEYSLTMSRQ
jgi:hypothetical protein